MIGLFDSGFGGLTLLSRLQEEFSCSTVYFADTAHVPYGDKSPKAILRYSLRIAKFLVEKKVSFILIACHTASSYVLPFLQKEFNVPILGVITPSIDVLLSATKTKRVGILSTNATLLSRSYTSEIQKRALIFSSSAPLLVPLIEQGKIDFPETHFLVKQAIQSFHGANIDALLLACTHFPLVKGLFQKYLDPGITLVDPTDAIISSLKKYSLPKEEHPRSFFYVSDDPEKFQSLGALFLGKKIDRVEEVFLEEKDFAFEKF